LIDAEEVFLKKVTRLLLQTVLFVSIFKRKYLFNFGHENYDMRVAWQFNC